MDTTPEPREGALRILVRTHPIGSNYGGVLQAWALQSALNSLGCVVDTDLSHPMSALRAAMRAMMLAKMRLVPHPFVAAERQRLTDGALLAFIDERMRTVRLFPRGRRPSQRVLRNYDAFVVGSDQVWRPGYSDVAVTLFNFIDYGDRRPIYSYAASFGVDSSTEYSVMLREATAPLAARLSGVSVREDSGVGLAEELWGIAAARHLDPTMLYSRTAYDQLICSARSLGNAVPEGGISSYILDPSPSTHDATAELCRSLGMSSHSLLPSPGGVAATSREVSRKMSPEEWLKSIRDASFVLTDSFHGTVFCVLFRKPFIVLPNMGRGAARFSSLLGNLGLDSRVVSSAAGYVGLAALAQESIDWESVESRLRAERRRAWGYLKRIARVE